MLDHKISITEVLTSEDILIQKVVFEEFTVVKFNNITLTQKRPIYMHLQARLLNVNEQ